MAPLQPTLATNVVPFVRAPKYRVECCDNLDFMRSLKKESMHLIVTSPPYNLGKVYEKKKTTLDLYVEQQAATIV